MRDDPNPRRALVVGAADAAYWVMQRTLVELLVRREWTGQPVRQHAQTADHYLVQAYQRQRICSPELGCEFRTLAPRKYAILSGLGRAVAHKR